MPNNEKAPFMMESTAATAAVALGLLAPVTTEPRKPESGCVGICGAVGAAGVGACSSAGGALLAAIACSGCKRFGVLPRAGACRFTLEGDALIAAAIPDEPPAPKRSGSRRTSSFARLNSLATYTTRQDILVRIRLAENNHMQPERYPPLR